MAHFYTKHSGYFYAKNTEIFLSYVLFDNTMFEVANITTPATVTYTAGVQFSSQWPK